MTKSVLDIVAWNVYIGNKPETVLAALRQLIKERNPEVVVLMEASRLYPYRERMKSMGYKVTQLKPKPLRPGSQPGQANIVILVRNDVRILRRGILAMTTFWLGPKHGWPQDPRVYRWVRIKWQGTVWKVGGAHTPFGKAARKESRIKLVRWLRRTLPGRPTALVLDANMNLHDFREVIAEPGGAMATGDGIDLIAYKNAVMLEAKNLGRRVSDHPAMYYKLREK